MSSTNSKYSIIVPIYNVEKYLRECLDSIINQIYIDYELILVDDGSLDNCGKICDEYASNDNRIKVIHKENGGLRAAWMSGVEIATGEYIGSIDSDDYIDIEMLARIEEVVKKYNPEIIVYGYKSVDDTHLQIHKYVIPIEKGLYDRKRKEKEIFPSLINKGCFEERSCVYLSRVNKFIKADLLKKHWDYYHIEIDYGEDNLWTIPNVLDAESIYVMSDYYPYNYRFNSNSITHSFNKDLWCKFDALDKHTIKIIKALGAEKLIYQVYCDSVFHAAISINNVVMDTMERKHIVNTIRMILNNENVVKGLKYMKPQFCSLKEKINIFFMKHKACNTIYFIKRLQKVYLKKIMRR